VPYTRGFKDFADLMDHYQSHVSEFGVKAMGPTEYQELADAFLGGPTSAGVHEHTRSKGDRLRFNPVTNEFGVLSASGFIRTYYKPDPIEHGEATNMDYYLRECGKH
jgi:pyocin large subunit-like protein